MDSLRFVQRKTNVDVQSVTRPPSLGNLDFLGHALLGGIYYVYFNNSQVNQQNPTRIPKPIPAPPRAYDFELSTLTLIPGLGLVSYKTQNGQYDRTSFQLPEDGNRTFSPIVFPLLVNILPAGTPHPFIPDCWHTCEDVMPAAGKFGCPRILFGFSEELIVFHYNDAIKIDDSLTVVDPYLIALVLPNQNLVYYIVPQNKIHGVLQDWHAKIELYRAAEENNLFAAAESPIIFNDDLQMFLCINVLIPDLEDTTP